MITPPTKRILGDGGGLQMFLSWKMNDIYSSSCLTLASLKNNFQAHKLF